MVMKKVAIVLATLSGFTMSAAFADETAGIAQQSHMKTIGRTTQPIGHYVYCQQYARDCRIKSNVTKAPRLTRKRWSELVEINTLSNSTIAPYTDQEIYNQEEVWAYPSSYGDCEDYVLMKRHLLMERGWPPSSLLITVVLQENGEGHAVLTVRTDRADYILDNLSSKIMPWHETPYRYLKRQSERHSGHWQDIADNRTS